MSGQISHKNRFLNLGLTSNLILLRLDAWATSSKHIRQIDPWTRMVGSERTYPSKYAIHAMGCVTHPQSPRPQHDFSPRFKVLKLRIAFVSLAKTSWFVSRDCGEFWCHGSLYACNRKIKMHNLKIYIYMIYRIQYTYTLSNRTLVFCRVHVLTRGFTSKPEVCKNQKKHDPTTGQET